VVLSRTDLDCGRIDDPDSGRFDDPDSRLIFFSYRYRTVISKNCRDSGSNRGPLDLQSNALPTELSRLVHTVSHCTIYLLFVNSYEHESVEALRVASFHVFGPPRSGSGPISTRYGSGSGYFFNQAKIARKILIPTIL
jgi:hypothetical protein